MSERSELPYRLAVLSRAAAAVFGGYATATALSVLLSQLAPMPRGEGVMAALLLSFAVYTCAVIWSFSARSASRAWVGLLVPTLASGIAWWLTSGTGTI